MTEIEKISFTDLALQKFKNNTYNKFAADDYENRSTYQEVKDFMLTHRYIQIGGHDGVCLLTEPGMKAKQLGGHQKYVKWKSSQNFWSKARKIAFWILFAGGVLAGVDVIIKWWPKKEASSITSPSDTTKPTQNPQPLTQGQKVIPDTIKGIQRNPEILKDSP